MSTPETNADPKAAVAAKAPKKPVFATLVRGQTYCLGSKQKFEKGISKQVTDEEVAILKRDAIDEITVEGAREVRQKFRFTDAPIEANAPRERVRQRPAQSAE
jgi:hypothetical protein